MIGSRNFAFLLMAVRFWFDLRFRSLSLLLIVLHQGCDFVEDIFVGVCITAGVISDLNVHPQHTWVCVFVFFS